MVSLYDINSKELEGLIEARNEAMTKGEDTFIYMNTPFVLAYANYLIEYLRPKLYKRGNRKNLQVSQKH